MNLRLRDVVHSAPPSTDRRAQVFFHEGRVYRAFRGEAAELFRRLLGETWLTELFDAGLVRFWPTEVRLEGFDLVVEVERVATVTYPPEWPTAVLREAGATIARLGGALAPHGLTLADGHPWNVLFSGHRAVFVDLGSIAASGSVSQAWAWEFRRHVVLPLALYQRHLHSLGERVQTTQRGSWTARLDRRVPRLFPFAYWRLRRHLDDPKRFFSDLGSYMDSLGAQASPTAWSEYYVEGDARVGEPDLYNAKQSSVDALLDRCAPGTVLDVGSNAGWYARLAATKGRRVVALDIDDRTLSQLYGTARHEDLPILPLRIDLLWPPGSSGLALEYQPAPARLRAETVMLLAVVHHLVAWQGATFEVIARTVDMFAAHSLIVEFVPPSDEHVALWPMAMPDWYTQEAFVAALSPFFQLLDDRPSTPDPRRILYFERTTSS